MRRFSQTVVVQSNYTMCGQFFIVDAREMFWKCDAFAYGISSECSSRTRRSFQQVSVQCLGFRPHFHGFLSLYWVFRAVKDIANAVDGHRSTGKLSQSLQYRGKLHNTPKMVNVNMTEEILQSLCWMLWTRRWATRRLMSHRSKRWRPELVF